MDNEASFERFQELQRYVGWTPADAERVRQCASLMEPYLPAMVDDFYEEIQRHPRAVKVITGGQQQIERLKGTLRQWLKELLAGPYDSAYVARRWQVGWRHVEIGLDQVYTNVALSRLRHSVLAALDQHWTGAPSELPAIRRAINMLIDLDLAVIEDAYQSEYLARQQRSERLAAIGQVAGGIAHELRNPLNVIKTSAYYLLHARTPSPEKQAEHLKRIERHVALADGVITALSNFAKMSVPSLQPFSVTQCVQEALENNPVRDNVKVTLEAAATAPLVIGDQDQLRIVFANLIRNANEAMPNGGTLLIRENVVDEGVEVAFNDSGVGISAADVHRVMEPLFSTKARGLGLGLAIARAILEKNDGSMRLTSELGKGSTFTVRLRPSVA